MLSTSTRVNSVTQADVVTSLSDRVSFLAILIFFSLLPFHVVMTTTYPYYREIFAVIFAFMGLFYLTTHRRRNILHLELRMLIPWGFYLIFSYIIDPEIILYGDEHLLSDIVTSGQYSPKLYVLRNLFLYLPLLLLICLRGLSKREFILLLSVICILSPFSIIVFYRTFHIYGISEIESLIIERKSGLHYNDYVPSLTFAVIVGLYLSEFFKRNFLKFTMLAASIFVFGYIVLSTSRQSVLFCLTAFWFAMRLKRLRGVFQGVVITGIILLWLLSRSQLFEVIIKPRYFSSGVAETPRIEIMLDGLKRLDGLYDWILGKGLSSVVYSGPHNNYIRFIQRIGLIGMALTFFPFFLGFKRLLRLRRSRFSDKVEPNLLLFITLSLFFTLYHSFFAYPHEDAFNAPYVWLGFSLYIVMKNTLFFGQNGNPRSSYE